MTGTKLPSRHEMIIVTRPLDSRCKLSRLFFGTRKLNGHRLWVADMVISPVDKSPVGQVSYVLK
ncbi:hypothetical protein ACFL2Q_17865 [Thermodesulfobacteriota bacterium]